MKKVIFIGGTSFSGSTILDMILANDPHGFSCGEVKSLFYPTRPHHIKPECGCEDKDCSVWVEVKKRGVHNLFNSLFELNPEAEFIVDSSKDPFWIDMQSKNLQKSDIEVENVLIWKTPLELASSFQKRGRLDLWEQSMVHYYRLYLSLVADFVDIKYNRLTSNAVALQELCDKIEIPFFYTKQQYWEKTHHTLFGNNSAKIHLYQKDTRQYIKSREHITEHVSDENQQGISTKYRKIYYNRIDDSELNRYVAEKFNRSEYITKIFNTLNNAPNNKSVKSLKYSATVLSMIKFKNELLWMTRCLWLKRFAF